MSLKEIRAGIAEALKDSDAGLKSIPYVSENITPPCTIVVPGRPYLASSGPDLSFGFTRVRHDVLIVGARDGAKRDADAIDDLIDMAWSALEEADYDAAEATRPDVVTLSGAKFLASVISIQHDVRL